MKHTTSMTSYILSLAILTCNVCKNDTSTTTGLSDQTESINAG